MLKNYEQSWRKAGGESEGKPDWIFRSFTCDPKGVEADGLLHRVQTTKPRGVLFDAPRGFNAETLISDLAKKGFATAREVAECSRFGDVTARTRTFVLAWRLEAWAGKGTPKFPRRIDKGGGA